MILLANFKDGLSKSCHDRGRDRRDQKRAPGFQDGHRKEGEFGTVVGGVHPRNRTGRPTLRSHTRQNIVTPERAALVLIAIIAAVFLIGLLLPEIRFMSTKLRYDNQPPITYHRFEWIGNKAFRGDRITYRSTYSKRAGCHPPDGRGWITYKFRHLQPNGQPTGLTHTVSAVRDADWPAGANLPGHSFAPVPEGLKPGKYEVWGEANFECANASKMLFTSTPRHVVSIL